MSSKDVKGLDFYFIFIYDLKVAYFLMKRKKEYHHMMWQPSMLFASLVVVPTAQTQFRFQTSK
jgi:hypothetical protein